MTDPMRMNPAACQLTLPPMPNASMAAAEEATMVAVDVPVRTGPGDDFVLEFRLHEGTKVRLREVRDDWARVSVEGTDLEGWLPERTVEEI